MDNISDKSDKEEIFLSFGDIKKIWKKDLCEINNCKDVINKEITLIGRLFNFNIYQFNKMILIGYNNSIPKSWYKLKSINDLHIFIDYFQEKSTNRPITEKPIDKQIILYLTSRFNFKQLIKYFYFHEFMDKQIWSENDKIDIKNITYQDEILLFDRFLETITDSSNITFITKYSKSKLILSSNKNGYYVKILYQPFKLYNRFKILSKDVPSDIDIILLNLDIIRSEDIMENINKIKEKEIEEKDIDILFDIAPKDKLKLYMSQIIEIKPELDTYITKKISLIDMNITIDKMEKDGVFKAFENSFEILLKTIYERFNDSDYDQSENMLELNKKIKNKITKIFESKII
jgi:hypothetical protein